MYLSVNVALDISCDLEEFQLLSC